MGLVIGIAGASASGKTSLTKELVKRVGEENINIIRYDDYYKNQSGIPLEERIKTNYDHPDAFDTDLLISDLKKLKAGETINKPLYDFNNHTRKKETEKMQYKPVIIVEGIFTLLEENLRILLDIKLFTYEDSDICFIRRLNRDIKQRGRTIDSVVQQYMNTVKPMQEKFIEPTKKYADMIILRGRENHVAIDMVSQNIKENLDKGEK